MAGRSSGRLAAFAFGLCVGALVGFVAVDLELTSLVSFWGDKSVIVVAAALLLGLAWLSRLRRLVAALAVAAGALWLVVTFTPLTAVLARGLVRRDPPRSADAVFVFGSSLQTDGEPSSEAMSRLLKGLQLVAEGRASRLIVSEQPHTRPYEAVAREWAHDLAPGAEILVVGPVRNTRDEAVAVAQLCREHGWRRVLSVTAPVHTRRASAALEQAGLEVVSAPSIETRYDLETLDRGDDRRRGFGAVLHERVGLLVYRWRGWLRGPA